MLETTTLPYALVVNAKADIKLWGVSVTNPFLSCNTESTSKRWYDR